MKILKNIDILLKRLKSKRKIQIAKKTLAIFESPYRLHIGCGTIKLDKWINIDINSQNPIADVVWDASCGLSFAEDSSCLLIYNEHFLEHLLIEQAVLFLSDCYRVLKPNGVLRIAMPSLEYVINKYQSEGWRNQDWLSWKEYQFIETRAEMLNISMRWWGHQWLYDREELHRRLKEAGFTIIRDEEWGNSEINELNNLETRKDSILICEAVKG
jgi:predicted SAM-dependent methyltransferase